MPLLTGMVCEGALAFLFSFIQFHSVLNQARFQIGFWIAAKHDFPRTGQNETSLKKVSRFVRKTPCWHSVSVSKSLILYSSVNLVAAGN